jgi:hypothetical protein
MRLTRRHRSHPARPPADAAPRWRRPAAAPVVLVYLAAYLAAARWALGPVKHTLERVLEAGGEEAGGDEVVMDGTAVEIVVDGAEAVVIEAGRPS